MRWRRIKSNAKFMKWDEPGQAIEGTFKGLHEGTYGQLGTIQTADGEIQFAVLTALACLEGVQDGQMVRIEYLGEETSKAGRQFKAFAVDVLDEETAPAEAQEKVPF